MKKTFSVLLCLVLLLGMTAVLAEAWTCPNCGGESEGAFCPWCGQKKPEEIVCPECGAVYDAEAGYAFCMTCGASLTGDGAAADLSVGDTVTFGHYEQDNDASNGQEAIEWIVLDTDGVTATLISRYALDCKPYNTKYEDVTWEACTLRKWLNDDFLNAAFTADEQAKLLTTTVTADKNPGYSTDPGSDTQDLVWLLSIPEAKQYFASDDARKCALTDYAIAQGAYTNSDYMVDGRAAGVWWLRSPGLYQSYAAYVYFVGLVSDIGNFVDIDSYAVRPVVRFSLS